MCAADAAAFERLYARYHARVYGFLQRLVGRRDRADDLFQETWLAVARSWAGRGRADIADEEAWLFTVARNVYLSARRSSAAQERGAAQLTLVPSAPTLEPDRIAQGHEEVVALEAAWAELSEDDRAILWLVAAEGLEQQQVARVLRIAYPAVRQRLARARARLSEHLAGVTVGERSLVKGPVR